MTARVAGASPARTTRATFAARILSARVLSARILAARILAARVLSARVLAMPILAILLAAGVLGGCSCGAPAQSAEAPATETRDLEGLREDQASIVVARIDGRAITALDVAEEIASRGEALRLRSTMPQHRDLLVDQMIDRELWADEARRHGLDRRPEVIRARREALSRALGERLRGELRLPEPSEEDVRARYEADLTRWRMPERIRARFIAFRDRAGADAALEQLRGARRLDEAWRRQASRGFASPMAPAAGELGPFARAELARAEDAAVPPPIARAAFEAAVGAVIPAPIEHAGLFYLVLPIAREPATDISLEDARARITAEIREAALSAQLEEIALGGRTITVDDDALAQVIDPWERGARAAAR